MINRPNWLIGDDIISVMFEHDDFGDLSFVDHLICMSCNGTLKAAQKYETNMGDV